MLIQAHAHIEPIKNGWAARCCELKMAGHGKDAEKAMESLRRSVYGWCLGLQELGELERAVQDNNLRRTWDEDGESINVVIKQVDLRPVCHGGRPTYGQLEAQLTAAQDKISDQAAELRIAKNLLARKLDIRAESAGIVGHWIQAADLYILALRQVLYSSDANVVQAARQKLDMLASRWQSYRSIIEE